MIERLFLRHPRSVGERYVEHAATAFSFGVTLFIAGGAAMVHAAVPALFPTTASGLIRRLHTRLTARQRTAADGTIEYVI